MTIKEVNQLMLEKSQLVIVGHDYKIVSLKNNTNIIDIIKNILELVQSNFTYKKEETSFNNNNIQCCSGKNRSIHDLYLIYKGYFENPISFSKFNSYVYEMTKKGIGDYKYYSCFRCPDIANLVVIHNGNDMYKGMPDCFEYNLKDYIAYEEAQK